MYPLLAALNAGRPTFRGFRNVGIPRTPPSSLLNQLHNHQPESSWSAVAASPSRSTQTPCHPERSRPITNVMGAAERRTYASRWQHPSSADTGFLRVPPWSKVLVRYLQVALTELDMRSLNTFHSSRSFSAPFSSPIIAAGEIIRVDLCRFRDRSSLSPVTKNSAPLASASARR